MPLPSWRKAARLMGVGSGGGGVCGGGSGVVGEGSWGGRRSQRDHQLMVRVPYGLGLTAEHLDEPEGDAGEGEEPSQDDVAEAGAAGGAFVGEDEGRRARREGVGGGGLEAEGDDGDVVGAAEEVGECDEFFGGAFEGEEEEDGFDPGVIDDAGEAVGADEEDIVGGEGDGAGEFGFEFFGEAKAVGDGLGLPAVVGGGRGWRGGCDREVRRWRMPSRKRIARLSPACAMKASDWWMPRRTAVVASGGRGGSRRRAGRSGRGWR